VPIDGSIAVVVSNAEYGPDCPHRPVRVEAIGGSNGAGGWFHRDDYPKMAMSDATAQMWSRTELKPADLAVAELYDGFTYLTIAWLEALGVCGDGEAGPFVEGGARIARDGELPLNTYGGQLSAGRMHGYWAAARRVSAVARRRGAAAGVATPRGRRGFCGRRPGRGFACCSRVETACRSAVLSFM